MTRSPRARLVFRRRRKVAGDTGWLIIEDDHGAPIVEAAPPVTEQLRYIIERLRLQDPDGLPTRIGVTSALAGEGVTTVARALAGVLADDSAAKVCLVSLDWWTSDASPADRMGIAEVIAGEAETDEVLLATSIPGLEYIRAGSAEPATLPALVHDATLRNTLQELALRYHHVVVELPPVRVASEALALAGLCDACALVVRQSSTSRTEVRAAIDHLGQERLLGVILNQTSSKVPTPLLRAVAQS